MGALVARLLRFQPCRLYDDVLVGDRIDLPEDDGPNAHAFLKPNPQLVWTLLPNFKRFVPHFSAPPQPSGSSPLPVSRLEVDLALARPRRSNRPAVSRSERRRNSQQALAGPSPLAARLSRPPPLHPRSSGLQRPRSPPRPDSPSGRPHSRRSSSSSSLAAAYSATRERSRPACLAAQPPLHSLPRPACLAAAPAPACSRRSNSLLCRRTPGALTGRIFPRIRGCSSWSDWSASTGRLLGTSRIRSRQDSSGRRGGLRGGSIGLPGRAQVWFSVEGVHCCAAGLGVPPRQAESSYPWPPYLCKHKASRRCRGGR